MTRKTAVHCPHENIILVNVAADWVAVFYRDIIISMRQLFLHAHGTYIPC